MEKVNVFVLKARDCRWASQFPEYILQALLLHTLPHCNASGCMHNASAQCKQSIHLVCFKLLQEALPGIAVVPREAYTTPLSPADSTNSSRSTGRALAGVAVVGPTTTMWGEMGQHLRWPSRCGTTLQQPSCWTSHRSEEKCCS